MKKKTRSSVTGKYVSADYGKKNPKTTVKETACKCKKS